MSLENYHLVHDDGCDYYIPLVCYICDDKKSADDLHLFSAENLKNMEDLKICQLEKIIKLNRHCFLCETCYTLIKECSNKIRLIKHSPFLFNRYSKSGCLLCQDHRMVSVYMLESNLEYTLVCKLVNRSSVERMMTICFICKEKLMVLFKLHRLCCTTEENRDNRRREWKQHLTLKYGENTFSTSNNKISYTIEELLVLMPPQNAVSQMAQDLCRLLGIVKFITPILILNEREINYINYFFSTNRQHGFAHPTDTPLNPLAAPFPYTNQDYTIDNPIGYSDVGLASNTISSESAAVYTEPNETYYTDWENTLNNPDQNSVDQIVTDNTENEYNVFDYDSGTEQPHLGYVNPNENFTVTTEFFDTHPRVVDNEIEMPMLCNESSSTAISQTNIIDYIDSLLFGTCATQMNDNAIDIEHDSFSTNREVYTPRAAFIDENEIIAILESELAFLDINTHLDTTITNSYGEASSTADKTSTTHDVQSQGRSKKEKEEFQPEKEE